jgi:glutaredoxin
MKQIIYALILLLIVLGIGYYLKNSPQVNRPKETFITSGKILFVSETCPHCKNVEQWLNENQSVKDKINLEIKGIETQENKELLGKKAAECQIDLSKGIGVPFLYYDGKCISGDSTIIDYLKSL